MAQFDKRGTGCSERIPDPASVEERMEDFHIVLDAAGWDRATVYGLSEGGPLACLFAATYPERTDRLVLQGSFARILRGPNYELGYEQESYDSSCAAWAEHWGTPETMFVPAFAPSQLSDDMFGRFWAKLERLSLTPAMLRANMALNAQIDIRHVLPTIQVPTLVIHARQDLPVPIELGRYLAAHIPEAQLFEYDGEHFPLLAGVDEFLDALETFVTGTLRARPSDDRTLSTVVFTDICNSTRRASALGDHAWKQLLDRHDEAMRLALSRHGGVEIKTTGDGLLSTFDSPTRAVRCGSDIVAAASGMGIAIRAGIHTGEVERRGTDVAGIAVHIAARVAASAGADEVLVSQAVPPVVVGSGLQFVDRGEQELRGVPGRWRLYAVEA